MLIRLRGRDLSRVPVPWTRYESRKSTLTGAPRAATNPVNALLNYVYSLLESESRLALLAAGLDPTLGVLHADQRNRDSFALDVMEPVRPAVDAFVLDLLEERVLTSRDFVELPNGVCRVRAPLTHDLALTLPRWRQLMAPIVAHLAQAFRDATGREPRRRFTHCLARPRAHRRSHAHRIAALRDTSQSLRQPRPYASKAWGTPRPEPLATRTRSRVPLAAEPVVKRRRRHCDDAFPASESRMPTRWSSRLARPSPNEPLPATIPETAARRIASVGQRMPSTTAAITNGRVSTAPTGTTIFGSGARSRRSSARIR